MVTPPELNSVEAPSTATIVCQGDTFTFKLDQASTDNGSIYLVIEASKDIPLKAKRCGASRTAPLYMYIPLFIPSGRGTPVFANWH